MASSGRYLTLCLYVLIRFQVILDVLHFTQCLTFGVQNRPDWPWIFQEGSTVTLECTHSFQRGVHTFIYDSAPVFACSATTCNTLNDDQGGFSFTYDLNNGSFAWILYAVKTAYNGKLFECKDGINSTSLNITVTTKDVPKKNTLLYALFILLLIPIFFIMSFIFCKCWGCKSLSYCERLREKFKPR